MYNRYIPQPDGSYRRNRIPDPTRVRTHSKHQMQPPPREASPSHQPEPCPPPQKDSIRNTKRPQQETSIPSFLKKLIPQGMDTGDLLVVILLLLMAGDCQEDQNHALLTLVLYLFL